MRLRLLLLAFAWAAGSSVNLECWQAQPAVGLDSALITPVAVINDYKGGLSSVRASNPEVRLSVGRDPAVPDERVLQVDYPLPTNDPAGRDVQCDAENQNWSAGRAISFRIKADHATRLSVSFMDRNRVVYTAWTDLTGGTWQIVRIPFADIRPNPYFQPPDAKTGGRIDVSDVKFVAFAPQDRTSGRLAIGRIVVSQ